MTLDAFDLIHERRGYEWMSCRDRDFLWIVTFARNRSFSGSGRPRQAGLVVVLFCFALTRVNSDFCFLSVRAGLQFRSVSVRAGLLSCQKR